jgi:acetyltransferase
MGIHNLDGLFNPKRIALIGVTINPNSVGGKVLSNLISGGFKGVVYPINPTSEAVLGILCHPDIKSLKNKPDLAILSYAADKVPGYIRECGENGVMNIIIMSSGFKEAGEMVDVEKEI